MIRVRYFTGQILGAADFEAEQRYVVDRLRRRNRWLHGWGMVGGLQVSMSQGQVVVGASGRNEATAYSRVSRRDGSWPTRRMTPRWRMPRRAGDQILAASRMGSRSRGSSGLARGGSWTRAIGPGAPGRSREAVTLTRIHIFGASGSGTSSLASTLAAKHGHRHLDTDDFYWLPTDPPYTQPRPVEARLALLRPALAGSAAWVLSGSLCGWGDSLIPQFDLVVFLVVPTEVRLARLRAREAARYGHEAIAPGGALHGAHLEFLEWAARYDPGDVEMRSRALHEAWIMTLPGSVLRLEGDRPVAEQLARIEDRIQR